MISKSNITNVYLSSIAILLLFGYFVKAVDSLPQRFQFEKEAIASNNVNISASNVDLYIFEPIPTSLEEEIKAIKVEKEKVKKVNAYLSSIFAPLASKSEFLVQAAKYYKIDYRLVAAISVIESSGGKYTYRKYNAWGWGGSSRAFTFKSWEEAIITVSRGLARYYSFGADTPREIAPSYNPVTPKEWGNKVTYVMSRM